VRRSHHSSRMTPILPTLSWTGCCLLTSEARNMSSRWSASRGHSAPRTPALHAVSGAPSRHGMHTGCTRVRLRAFGLPSSDQKPCARNREGAALLACCAHCYTVAESSGNARVVWCAHGCGCGLCSACVPSAWHVTGGSWSLLTRHASSTVAQYITLHCAVCATNSLLGFRGLL